MSPITTTRKSSPRHDAKGRVRPPISVAQRAVYHILRRFGPSADFDLVRNYPTLSRRMGRFCPQQTDSGIRTRRAELVRKGYVEDSGDRVRGDQRQCIVWRAI